MEQEIRYLDVDGRRLAYSIFGDGPPLLVGPRWVSHLEEEWADPDQRPFVEHIGIDARPAGTLDKFGGIYVKGRHYPFQSFEAMPGPPPKKAGKHH